MKFKKIFVLIITIILATCLVGCENQNTEKAVANNLSKSADKLSSVVQNLEEVENSDIIIEELSPISENYSANQTSNRYTAQNSSNKYNFGKHILSAMEFNLDAKPKQSSNAKYVNGEKITLNEPSAEENNANDNSIICEDGKCYNNENCKDGTCYNKDINVKDIKEINVNKKNNNESENTTNKNKTQRLNSYNNKKSLNNTVKKQNLSKNINKNNTNRNINKENLKKTINNSKSTQKNSIKNSVSKKVETKNNTLNKSIKNSSKKNENTKNSTSTNQSNKNYSINQNNNKSFNTNNNTNNKTYKPKYINELSENINRDHLDKYLQKIENVYNACADCICCNEQCKIEQSKLEQNLKDCKVYSTKLKDGTITLSQEEISQCNNCLNSLSNCIERLKSTKGTVNLKKADIEKIKDNFGSNTINLIESYNKLSQTLECRLQYLKDCNANLTCIFDIINKTNVNVAEAEQNKSDESEILKNEEMLKEEEIFSEQNNYNDTILNNNLQSEELKNQAETNSNYHNSNNYNINNQNVLQNNSYSKNIGVAMAPAASETLNNDNNDEKRTAYNEVYNENEKQNNLNLSQNTNEQTNLLPKKDNRTINIESEKNPEKTNNNITVNNDNFDANNQSNNNNIDTYKKNEIIENVQQDTIAEQPKQIITQKTVPFVTNSTQNIPQQPVNNSLNNNNYGYNYPYGYNGAILPYGVNNFPYTPRNIDTYRYINKNIDTYRPNYSPVPNQNNLINNVVTEEPATHIVIEEHTENNNKENDLENTDDTSTNKNEDKNNISQKNIQTRITRN